MGKPFWGRGNLFTASTTTLGARTASTNYPVANLAYHKLRPPYRSADKCLVLNGTDEYAHVADAAGISITGDLTIEALFTTGDVSADGISHWLITKLDAAGGWALARVADELRLYLNGVGNYSVTNALNLAVDTWYRVKVVYDASAQEVTWWVNGASVAASTAGTIPASITDNAVRITIGSNAAGASGFWEGSLSCIGIDAADLDHGGYLNPSGCNAYWDFEDSDLTDSSGNGFTLTGVGIDSSNYADCTAYQFVRLAPSSAQPTMFFADSRHNLSTGATWQVVSGNVYLATGTVLASGTATAGTAICSQFAQPTASTAFWVEVHDPDNTDGYISIPYLFLGTYSALSRSFLKGYEHGNLRIMTTLRDVGGGWTGYAHSERLWHANLQIRANSADDTILEDVSDDLQLARPLVFGEDTADLTKTRLVYDATPRLKSHIIQSNQMWNFELSEAGGGL